MYKIYQILKDIWYELNRLSKLLNDSSSKEIPNFFGEEPLKIENIKEYLV
jgi:hypothetical protein